MSRSQKSDIRTRGWERCWTSLPGGELCVVACGIILLMLLNACQTSYPYLVLNDNCRCEQFTHKDAVSGIAVEIKARYRVKDAIISHIEITITNPTADTLDLRQGFIKGTSRNVKYAANDRFLPLAHVVILPSREYSFSLEGEDTDASGDPWLKIAGEQITIEIRKMFLGGKEVRPVVFTLVPHNPKLGA
jgi:hypothetical protein